MVLNRDFVIVWIILPVILGTIYWKVSDITAKEMAKITAALIIGAFLGGVALRFIK